MLLSLFFDMPLLRQQGARKQMGCCRYAASSPARSEKTKWAVMMSEFAPISIYLVISLLVSLILLGVPFPFASIVLPTQKNCRPTNVVSILPVMPEVVSIYDFILFQFYF